MKQNFLILFLICLTTALFAETRKEDCRSKAICLISIATDDGKEFRVRNLDGRPWSKNSIQFLAEIKNYESSEKLPHSMIVRGAEEQAFVSFKILDKSAYRYFSYSYKARLGDVNAVHNDSVIYELPFEVGKSFRIGQGYNGNFTHHGSSAYALDFSLPMRTPVLAAREGYVVAIEDRYTEGGTRQDLASKANLVSILHDDGTIGNYVHLDFNGVVVKLGDKISVSQLLGYSGNTGYSQGPHLHFEVNQPNVRYDMASLPTYFRTQNSSREQLTESNIYFKPESRTESSDWIELKDEVSLCRTETNVKSISCGINEFKLGEKFSLKFFFLKPEVRDIEVIK
ncbi:MAG: M23 family metallopeptidase [Leptospira sp.]|nr:M23 family metallopeptidase [Leptospira sp.]